MSLSIGQQVTATAFQSPVTVTHKLGEGGQGIVYQVDSAHGPQALKWYNSVQATEEQRQAIHTLVQSGPPRGPAGRRFVWPLSLVTAPHTPLFGYLMPLIETQRFATLDEVRARLKPAPDYPTLCAISAQIANSYRALHLDGYCYRDLNTGNLLFDPRTGEVLICDNDNVGVNCTSQCQVLGTMEFMAPEVILGQADPSTETDLYSLASLLFHLWCWHHPLHGLLEYNVRCWDLPAKRYVYGERPVFLFDPQDASNRPPNDPDYAGVRRLWQHCPPSLRELFLRAFTVGLRDPARRVTEGEWQRLFWHLRDGAIPCPACQAANLWEPALPTLSCWHCGKPIALPSRLLCQHRDGTRTTVLLSRDATLLERHLNPTALDDEALSVRGQVVQHPSDPHIFGLRNLTATPWRATFADGTVQEVAPQRAAPLNLGLRLDIAGVVAEMVA